MHIHHDHVCGCGHDHEHTHSHTHEYTHDGVAHTHAHDHAHTHESFTLCLPPCILLLKSCSRFSSPAIPSLMLLGFLSPAPLNHFWYFSGHFAFASLVPLALWTVHFFQAGLVWCSPLSS